MKKITTMEINKENAFKLWSSQFGKKQKVKDFAGREIIKSAYDDRNSRYGWNIDHILPQSKGGKSTESNLICCSIQTNAEKQDSFPCFLANDKNFEIKRVQNHYEIFEKDRQLKTKDSVNFFSAAEGIEYFESLINSGSNLFYSCISINLKLVDENVSNAICEFIRKIFTNNVEDSIEIVFGDITGKNIYYVPGLYMQGNKYSIYILNRNITNKEQVQNMLDTCILLNTYLTAFLQEYLTDYAISLVTKKVSYEYCSKDTKSVLNDLGMSNIDNKDYFIIDEVTKINTDLEKEQLSSCYINNQNCYICNYVYKQLLKDLKN